MRKDKKFCKKDYKQRKKDYFTKKQHKNVRKQNSLVWDFLKIFFTYSSREKEF